MSPAGRLESPDAPRVELGAYDLPPNIVPALE
jgi:hypothetical protein